jgi:hypothetical protein
MSLVVRTFSSHPVFLVSKGQHPAGPTHRQKGMDGLWSSWFTVEPHHTYSVVTYTGLVGSINVVGVAKDSINFQWRPLACGVDVSSLSGSAGRVTITVRPSPSDTLSATSTDPCSGAQPAGIPGCVYSCGQYGTCCKTMEECSDYYYNCEKNLPFGTHPYCSGVSLRKE